MRLAVWVKTNLSFTNNHAQNLTSGTHFKLLEWSQKISKVFYLVMHLCKLSNFSTSKKNNTPSAKIIPECTVSPQYVYTSF
jgi:hypothetical protein